MTGSIQIFWTNVDADAARAAMRYLSDGERTRYHRFVSVNAAAAFALGRALLRVGVGRCAHCAPSEVDLLVGRNGRLEIVAPAGDWDASISHSGDLVGCAVAHRRRIGFDVEFHRPGLILDDLINYAFSKSERQAFAAVRPAQRRDRFYSVWTAKEAILKATGEGLLDDLGSMSVDETPGRIVEHRDGVARRWRIARPKFDNAAAWAAVVHAEVSGEAPTGLSVEFVPPAVLVLPS